MTSPVNYTLTDNIGVITIDSPPVNALSQAVRQGIMDALDVADADASEAVVIIVWKGCPLKTDESIS